MEFIEVKSVNEYFYKGKVYDLEVETDHTYTINDYSVHNSSAGSLINYLLHITEVDPIKYDLLFERFLDLERYDYPDIDSDFQTRLRDKVIEHIIEKYGRDRVANIGTFGMLKIKSAIQDVARVCDIPSSDVFAITKKIPQDVNDTSTLEELEEAVPTLKTFLNKYDTDKMPIRWFINGVRGAHRQAGSHASGVLISSHSLMDNIAIIQSRKNIITGWMEGNSGHELSEIGYAKFDILGLNNLQVVQDTLELIKTRRGKDLTLDFINSQQGDQSIYQNLVKGGDHYGIFQMDCLHPDTIINGDKTIKELYTSSLPEKLTSYNEETKELIQNDCLVIKKSGKKMIFELELEDGKKIKCSENHKFLTKNGWKKLKDLSDNDEILSL